MTTALDSGDREFLERLHRLGSATIQEICDDQGVTATAVRQRLTRLRAMELIDREIQRSGRGRPRHLYSLTGQGLRLLGDNYSDLARILWQELKRIEDPVVRGVLFDRVQSAFVERYRHAVQGESLLKRLDELKTALVDEGFHVEVDTSGELPILRENSCPYLDLASSDPEICELEQAIFRKVLGANVTLTQCCLDGHHCCEFEAATVEEEGQE